VSTSKHTSRFGACRTGPMRKMGKQQQETCEGLESGASCYPAGTVALAAPEADDEP
jgi:hypothetical protein